MVKNASLMMMIAASALLSLNACAERADVVEYDPSVPTVVPKTAAAEVGIMSYVNDKFNRLERQLEDNADRMDRLERDSDRLKALEAKVDALEKKLAQTTTTSSTPAADGAVTDKLTTNATAKAPMSEADNEAAQAEYKKAFDQLMAGKYAESGKLFKAYVDKYPDSDQTGNAYYWLGETYFVASKYDLALKAYTESAKREGPKAAEALYKQGECYVELKKTKEAKQAFEEVKKRFPGSSAVKQADKALADMKK
ncbi:MAG: tol-pal system protein YbgF [Thiotrichales bacterium]|jgi:tol-pal system protein YbgF|nr:tol-pal system protein YbgF [Thiotrichales bacterium]